MGVVVHPQQREERRHQVYLRDHLIYLLRCDESRSEDQGGNVVFLQRDFGFAGTRGAMVGRNDENRVIEPGLAAGLFEEASQCVVGVHDASRTQFRIVRNRNPACRVGVGPVVADRHDVGEEGRCGRIGPLAERADHFVVGVFVANAPDVGEGDLFGFVAFLVDDSVAVAAEEGFHVVEVAVASVEVVGIVTLLPEYGRRGVHVVVAGTFDDALSGAGRQREGNGFESPHRAVTCGETLFESDPHFVERVQVGRDRVRIAEMLHERGAHALDGDQHDVAAQRIRVAGNVAQVVAGTPVDRVYVGFGLFLR